MKATCYLQVQPTFTRSGRLYTLSAARVTAKRPRTPLPNALIVKLTLDIADAAFLPLTPQADITIPVEHTAITVVTDPVEIVQ